MINEEEAEIVQKIYADFLADVPMGETARWLESIGCRCTTKQFVKSVLENPAYAGDLLLQRHFSPQVRRMQKNNGEMPKYLVTGHHPAIISREIFEQVQQKMQALLDFNPEAHRFARVSCFSSKSPVQYAEIIMFPTEAETGLAMPKSSAGEKSVRTETFLLNSLKNSAQRSLEIFRRNYLSARCIICSCILMKRKSLCFLRKRKLGLLCQNHQPEESLPERKSFC